MAALPTSICPTQPGPGSRISTAITSRRSARRLPSSTSVSTTAGQLADYIIDYLRRPVMSLVASREGEDYPGASRVDLRAKGDDHQPVFRFGGDAFALVFPQDEHRAAGRRPNLGRAGWDWRLSEPHGWGRRDRAALGDLRTGWRMGSENHGIAPDIEVEQDPKLVREGHDPQLEKAVKRS